MTDGKALKIMHVTRTPVGGIIRHILDLARGQAERGHEVGIVCDSLTGGERATAALADIAPQMKLGVWRLAISREISPTDAIGFIRVARHLTAIGADVLHGHGAKGGAFTRLMSVKSAIKVYTPHGGSLHYRKHSIRGLVYGNAERFLRRRTDLFLFESEFARNTYNAMVGPPRTIVRVVPNGVSAAEMVPVEPTASAAPWSR